jgi:hypothetical protein
VSADQAGKDRKSRDAISLFFKITPEMPSKPEKIKF